jgi:hypothetical protein
MMFLSHWESSDTETWKNACIQFSECGVKAGVSTFGVFLVGITLA